jgi:hypothetical protein
MLKNEEISQRYAAILICKLGKFVSDVTIVHKTKTALGKAVCKWRAPDTRKP